MTDFEALRADSFPVDAELLDAGCTGPELAHLAAGGREGGEGGISNKEIDRPEHFLTRD